MCVCVCVTSLFIIFLQNLKYFFDESTCHGVNDGAERKKTEELFQSNNVITFANFHVFAAVYLRIPLLLDMTLCPITTLPQNIGN